MLKPYFQDINFISIWKASSFEEKWRECSWDHAEVEEEASGVHARRRAAVREAQAQAFAAAQEERRGNFFRGHHVRRAGTK